MEPTVCGRCGGLVEPHSTRCDRCGRLAPGLFGFRPVLARIFPADAPLAKTLLYLLAALYLFTLLVSQIRHDGPDVSFFARLTPGVDTLYAFGMMRSDLVLEQHEWWRLMASVLLHGGVLHIVFNGMALLQLGAVVQQLYGPARLLTLFVFSGIGSFVGCALFTDNPTLGASGALFGLIAAVIVFGHKRGGPLGHAARQTGIQWLVYGLVFGLLFQGISNTAHVSGAIAGCIVAATFDLHPQRRESDVARLVGLLALLVLAATVVFMLIHGGVRGVGR